MSTTITHTNTYTQTLAGTSGTRIKNGKNALTWLTIALTPEEAKKLMREPELLELRQGAWRGGVYACRCMVRGQECCALY